MLKTACTTFAVVGVMSIVQNASAADTEVLSGDIQTVAKDHIVMKVKEKAVKVTVNSDTQITLNGKKSSLTELKSGFKVIVTAKKDGTSFAATKIAARSKASTDSFLVFADAKAEKYTGTVNAVNKATLQMTDAQKKTHSFSVGSEATITLNGKRATLSQLKKGFKVTITAVEKDGKLTAKTIAATSTDS